MTGLNNKSLIACSHPGKLGDALYALPTVKKLCEKHNCKADFYTSSYCEPMRNLVEFQSYINEFIVPEDYVVERMDLGCQPWKMPIDESKYEAVYQMGFQNIPDKSIPQYIAEQAGITEQVKIEYKFKLHSKYIGRYIVIAPRGETSYKQLFNEVADLAYRKPCQAIIIGAKSDYVGFGLDYTGLDMLSTLPLIEKSIGFVGLMSSQLVLANGFNIPKVAPHDGKSWDMRHVVTGPNNHYPVNPTAEEVLRLLNL